MRSPGRHTWDLGNGCCVCGCERREIRRMAKRAGYGKIDVLEYSMDGGRTWTETRPACGVLL